MRKTRVLIIVQNLPVPFDRRVWQEAEALYAGGYEVSIICPKGRGFEKSYESINGIAIYRHPLPFEASGAAGYLLEYGWSLAWEFVFSLRICFLHRFDVIHACNPPDLIFLIGGFFKLFFGTKFVFDHHDINPELYEAKTGRRGFFYKLLLLCERLTFRLADISIATNNSYRQIAITRGKMPSERVFVVRSGPNPDRIKIIAPVPSWKNGRRYMVGYVGVMGRQEGIDLLLEAVCHIIHDVKREDIQFVLVGGGTELAAMQALAAAKNIAEFVTFTGRVSDDILLEVLNTADVCVNPDRVNAMNDKSTMNKIMEYMCVGKPIVQFDMTEGRVSAGAASLYARADDTTDFAAKIMELLDNPDMRLQMGRFGRGRVENALAWKYEAPKLLAAYDALFSRQSSFQKLQWYYHRLRPMSLPEIFHRVVEKFKRIKDVHRPFVPHFCNDGKLPEIPGLRDKVFSEAQLAKFERQYEQAITGKFLLLGCEWPACLLHEKWHLDPISGRFWPKDRFCFAIHFRHNPSYGDVKYVWELNRLQYLQGIAALAFARRDEKIAKYAIGEIESWIDHNPPYYGINWASGIELALRLISIFTVASLVSEYATPAQRRKILETMYAHVAWIERYPSEYSSANNHKAAEALALFMVGALMGDDRLRIKSWQRLCDRLQVLILPDGSGAEQALSYTEFTLELFKFGLDIAKAYNVAVPDYYEARIKACDEYLGWFTDCRGNRPLIGDDDGGRVFAFTPPLTPPSRGEEYPPLAHIIQGVKTFHDGGYTVCRHDFQGKEIWLAMDHGHLGYGSIAAHGHADALAVWLHIDGQPVLADAGTYLYHGGGKWRDYFRSTEAHNTLCVEQASSSIMAGNFNWSHKANAVLIASEYGENYWQVEAQQDGYWKRFGVIHRRSLKVTPAAGFVVEDMLVGDKARHVSVAFLIHPALTVKKADSAIEIYTGDRALLKIAHESPLFMSIEDAWYAPRFGEKMSTRHILFSGMLAPGQKAVTYFDYR